MTWAEYARCAHGYMIRQSRSWEHTREIIAAVWNCQLDPKDRKEGKKLIPLPTDKLHLNPEPAVEAKIVTPDEFKRIVQFHNSIGNGN